jgi:hypothetical protein
MGMVTNGPTCSSIGRDPSGLPCSGRLHQYTTRMIAKPDGTPVVGAPQLKTYICEGHYPDVTDPKFLLCSCELCKGRTATN